eukprot:364743-Chlamydomonas_euryale.AAC.93
MFYIAAASKTRSPCVSESRGEGAIHTNASHPRRVARCRVSLIVSPHPQSLSAQAEVGTLHLSCCVSLKLLYTVILYAEPGRPQSPKPSVRDRSLARCWLLVLGSGWSSQTGPPQKTETGVAASRPPHHLLY